MDATKAIFSKSIQAAYDKWNSDGMFMKNAKKYELQKANSLDEISIGEDEYIVYAKMWDKIYYQVWDKDTIEGRRRFVEEQAKQGIILEESMKDQNVEKAPSNVFLLKSLQEHMNDSKNAMPAIIKYNLNKVASLSEIKLPENTGAWYVKSGDSFYYFTDRLDDVLARVAVNNPPKPEPLGDITKEKTVPEKELEEYNKQRSLTPGMTNLRNWWISTAKNPSDKSSREKDFIPPNPGGPKWNEYQNKIQTILKEYQSANKPPKKQALPQIDKGIPPIFQATPSIFDKSTTPGPAAHNPHHEPKSTGNDWLPTIKPDVLRSDRNKLSVMRDNLYGMKIIKRPAKANDLPELDEYGINSPENALLYVNQNIDIIKEVANKARKTVFKEVGQEGKIRSYIEALRILVIVNQYVAHLLKNVIANKKPNEGKKDAQ